jgi:hypothetical protein
MENESKNRRSHINAGSAFGSFWYVGWLFAIGLAKLSFWKAVLALVVWPYYIGHALAL